MFGNPFTTQKCQEWKKQMEFVFTSEAINLLDASVTAVIYSFVCSHNNDLLLDHCSILMRG